MLYGFSLTYGHSCMSQILTIRNHVWFPLSMQKFMKEKLGPDADFAWARDQIRRGFAGKPLNFLCNNNYSTNSVTWEESLYHPSGLPRYTFSTYLQLFKSVYSAISWQRLHEISC